MDMEVTLLKKKRCKRGISFLLVLSLVMSVIYVTPGYGKEAKAASVWNGYTATSYEAGNGTKDNPYQIRWGSQLAFLAKNVSEGETYAGKYFVLTADIQMNVTDSTGGDWTTWTSLTTGLNEWQSIGTYESADSNRPFAGIFNGEGHTIRGVWSCNRKTNGLFGYNTGTISDIHVEDSYIEGSGYGVGAVAGKNAGTISGCDSNSSIVSMWADDNNIEAGSAGGIAGTNSGTVNHSVNRGKINGVGVTGGVVGTNAGRIINSSNEGVVGEDVKSRYGTGGIAGCNSKEASEVINCCNRGDIFADNYAGGIVGTNVGKIVNAYNDANIDITQGKGIAGAVSGTLEKSGFDSSGSVAYAYWNADISITANGTPCTNVAAGYTGQNGIVDANSCEYNAGGFLLDDAGKTKEIEFTISGVTEKKSSLTDVLDSWTQSDEGGKGSQEYFRWEDGDDGLPKVCEKKGEVWNGDVSNSFGGGDGSVGTPYRITDGKQLKYLSAQVNSGNSYSGEHFVLTADIYLNDETFTFQPDTGLVEVTDGVNTAYIGTGIAGDVSGGDTQFDTTPSEQGKWYTYGSAYVAGTYAGALNPWTPIGTASKPFAGKIDGKGYKVYGVYVNNYACEGLFGYIGGGSVNGLGINNSCFLSADSSYVGSVTGYISGSVTNCNVDNTSIVVVKSHYTGGIAGYFADSKTNSDGSYKDAYLMFGNSFSTVVCGNGKTGGICGYSGYGNRIDECLTKAGTWIKGSGSATGGITGKNYGSTIVNTYNLGNVSTDNAKSYIGGIAGENMSEGQSCIEGYPDIFGIIVNCYSRGKVTGGASSYTGGIAGHNFGGTVANSYCDGTVTGGTFGGVAGVNNISEGKYVLYDGMTQQQYKKRSGDISYAYAVSTVCGSNLCDTACITESVTFTQSAYALSQSVLGRNSLCEALNAWVISPDEGFGNDANYKKYLQWVYPSNEYPQFDGSHFSDLVESEPLPKYSLIYNPNGDDVQGEMEPVVYQMTLDSTPEDEKPIVDDVGYSREGYNFGGWNTSPDGNGDTYMPGDRISITDTTNLYAVWVSTQAVITGTEIKEGNNVTIRWSAVDDASGYWIYRQKAAGAGQTFTGFNDADKIGEADAGTLSYEDKGLDAGTYYYGIRAYSISDGGVTETFVFNPFSEPEEVAIETASITYISNVPGTTSSEKRECIVGKETVLIENPFTYAGYAFAGWNTKADSTGVRYSEGQVCSFAENTVLYAIWKIDVPADISAQILDGNIVLSWENNKSADGVQIYYSMDDEEFQLLDTVAPGMDDYNSYTIPGFDEAHIYSFYMRAFVNEEIDSGKYTTSYSDDSDTITVSADDSPEDKVVGVEGTINPDGTDGSKVEIRWREVGTASGYYVYRSENRGEIGQRIAQTADTAYVDESIPADAPGDYYYTVRAFVEDSDGIYYKMPSNPYKVSFESVRIAYRPNGAEGDIVEKYVIKGAAGVLVEECMFVYPLYEFSEWYSIVDETESTFLAGQTIPVESLADNINLTARWKLSAVSIVDLKVNPESSVTLTWTANELATGYNIYQRKGSNGMYVLVGNTDELTYTTTVFTDVTSAYYFYVVPYIESVVPSGRLLSEGMPSDIESVIPNPELIIEGQVTGVSAVIDRNNVILSWDILEDVTGYYIYRSEVPGERGECIKTITSGEEFTYTDSSALEVKTYYYSIRAFVDTEDAVYYKPWSEYADVTFEECVITYKANDYTEAEQTEAYIKGTEVNIIENPYLFPGRSFMSWNTDPLGKGHEYKPGDALELNESTVLYAIWNVERPQNVKAAISKENGAIDVKWDAVAGADGYVICRKSTLSDEIVERGTTTKTSFTDYNDGKPVGPDDGYYYYVRAYQAIDSDTRRFGDYSETTAYTVIGTAVAPTSKPVDTVTNLTIIEKIKDENKVKIGWSGIPAADGYRVFYSEGKDGEKIFTGFDKDASNMITPVLKLDVKYYYYVVAYIIDSVTEEYRLSDFSEGLEVMITSTPAPTPTPTPLPTPTPNPYGKIKNIRYEKKNSTSIELKWDALDAMSGYRVFRCDDERGTNPQKIGNDISGSALVIKDLEETKKHYFYVRGYIVINTDKGEVPDFSDRSDILTVSLATPTPTPIVTNTPKPSETPAPSNTPSPSQTPKPSESPGIKDSKVGSLAITDAMDSFINLSWEPLAGADEYELSYSNTIDGEKIVINRVSASETSFRNIEIADAMFNVRENIDVTDVQAYGQTKNAEYYYFIRAVANGEYSQYSDYVRVVLHTEQLTMPAPSNAPAPFPSPTLSPGTDDKYVVGSSIKVGKLIYRITAKSESAKTVEVVRPVKKTYKSVTIPATVKIGSDVYKVTSVKASAFLNNKKLGRIVFGKNIKKIGRKSFYGCKKLMKITFKSKNVTSFGKKSFHGITMRCRFIIPKSVLAKYKKLIRKTEG